MSFCAKRPFSHLSSRQLAVYIANGGRLPRPENISDALNELMLTCWNADPDLRPSAAHLLDRLAAIRTSSLLRRRAPNIVDNDNNVVIQYLPEGIKIPLSRRKTHGDKNSSSDVTANRWSFGSRLSTAFSGRVFTSSQPVEKA